MLKLNSTIESYFEKHFNGEKNFVTPNVVEYGATGKNVMWELSKGKGFTGQMVYGVTVLRLTKGNKTVHEIDLCKSFTDIDAARRHINSLDNY